MAKLIAVLKPARTDFDDGFFMQSIADGLPIATAMAQECPAPPEIVEEVEETFLRKNPGYVRNPAMSPHEDPLCQWVDARAALAHQLNWYVQSTGNPLITVADFYGPDSAVQSLFPAFVESEIQAGLIAEGLVSWLPFASVQVNADTVRDIYDATPASARSMQKVEIGAELPGVKFTHADSDVYMFKYGRLIEMAYEVIRRQTVDMLGHHLRRIGMQMAVDETDVMMDVLIAGDGTTPGSAETNATDVDVDTAGTILYSDLISWVYNPADPYNIDKAVGGKTDLALVTNLSEFKDRGKQAEIEAGLPTPLKVNYRRWDGGVTNSNYVDRLIVGIDSRSALKRYTQGSLLQENDVVISRQTRRWTVSHSAGHRKFDAAACHVLDTNAAL